MNFCADSTLREPTAVMACATSSALRVAGLIRRSCCQRYPWTPSSWSQWRLIDDEHHDVVLTWEKRVEIPPVAIMPQRSVNGAMVKR